MHKVRDSYLFKNSKKDLQMIRPLIPLICSFLLLLLSFSLQSIPVPTASAYSPSFVRQEIIDNPGDWIYWPGSSNKTLISIHDGSLLNVQKSKNFAECTVNGKFFSPDLESVSYISDGHTLNASMWLTSPFKQSSLSDNVDTYQEQVQINVSKFSSTLDNYVDIRKAQVFDPEHSTEFKENSTTLAGEKAYSLTYPVTQNQTSLKIMEILTFKQGKLYDVIFSSLNSTYLDYLPIIQKMLNSFQILSNNEISRHNTHNLSSLYIDNGISLNPPKGWAIEKKIVNGTYSVILRSQFEDQNVEEPSWHETTFTMAIDIDSVNNAGTDYRIILYRNPLNLSNGTWIKEVQEISAYDRSRTLSIEPNYTGVSNGKYFVLFSFDLGAINYPQKYKLVFYVTDYYLKNHRLCRLVDTTNWALIPPPEFVMTTDPNSMELRPGDEAKIALQIRGNSDLQSQAFLTTNSPTKNITTNFIPNKISIPPSALGTSTLDVKVLPNITMQTPTPVILPINANISFPSSISNRGGDTFSNNKTVTLGVSSSFTVTLLPARTQVEQFNSFVSGWVTPISGMWTFLAGVGAVVGPLVLHFYRKKQKRTDAKK